MNMHNLATDFFQCLYQLEQSGHTPLYEKLHIKGDFNFAMPMNDISEFKSATHTQKASLVQSALSLLGASGSLPEHYTELIETRLSHEDPTLLAFCDMLHHHLCHTFYMAWKSKQLYISYTQANPKGLHHILSSLSGKYQQDSDLANPDLYYYYAGFLGQSVRPQKTLIQILKGYFNLPFSINTFQGKWVKIDATQQTILSRNPLKAQHNQLGHDCLMGHTVWLAQNRFQIAIGPLSLQQYSDLLPNNPKLSEIHRIAHRYSGSTFDIPLQLIIDHTQIPPFKLSHEQPPQLGFNTWFKRSDSSGARNHITFQNLYLSGSHKQGVNQ